MRYRPGFPGMYLWYYARHEHPKHVWMSTVANPILIAVPQHLVPAVAELIASDGATANSTATGATTPNPLIHGWTEDTLRAHYSDSSPKMQAFLVHLAHNADREITSDDAAKAINYPDWNSIAGMLGAATRRAKNHFGRDKGPWHLRRGRDDHVRLKMPSDVARIILEEASKQDSD